MSLLTDLRDATNKAPCPLCVLIQNSTELTADALRDAAGGTIGVTRLARILAQHQTGIGRRTIERHRREEHTP